MKNLGSNRPGSVFVLLLIFSLFLSCSEEIIEEDVPALVKNASVSNQDLIEGNYIVVISEKPAKRNAKAAAVLEELSKELKGQAGARLKQTYKHTLTGFAAELTDKQVEKLERDPRVAYIEQDGYIYLDNTTNVQEYCTWGLDRIDQAESLLNRAYAYTATGSGVTAYILDSGIRYSHSEFEKRATLGYDFVFEENPENTDANQQLGEDCNGHGTHVAGTVGGNNWGVAKDIDLVSVRVFGCSGGSPRSRVIAAVDWITQDVKDNNRLPAVVNMSLGGMFDPEDMAYQTSIDNSILAGINYVAAAGNSTADACEFVPARFSNVVTVAASQIGDEKAYFSNFGECVNIFAPGANITSASIEDDNSFTSLSGTSMAAPHVAGVMALYLEKNPEASPAEVRAALVENSTPNAVSNVPSGPNNMVHSLWEPVEFTPPTPPNFNLTAIGEKIRGSNYANLKWTTTGSKYIKIYINGMTNWVEHFNDGEQLINLNDNNRNITYKIKICEVGYNNCSEEVDVIFGDGGGSGVEDSNETPTAQFTYSTNKLDVQFTDTSTDSDGSVVAWNWGFGDGNTSTNQSPTHTYSEAGTYDVSLTVTDDAGDTDSTLKSVQVSSEEPEPGTISLSATGYKVKGVWHADLSWDYTGAVDIYREGEIIASLNSGNTTYTDVTGMKGGGSLIYRICEAGSTANCSNEVSVQF